MTPILWIIIAVLFALAFAGLVVPVLPDALLLVAGFIIFHFFIDDRILGVSFWLGTGVIAVFVIAIDYIASGIGARKYGASKWSFIAAPIGIVIFPMFLGPIGILIGPFVMVLLTELLFHKTIGDAIKIGFGTLMGFLGGTFVKGMMMLALVIWFFWMTLV